MESSPRLSSPRMPVIWDLIFNLDLVLSGDWRAYILSSDWRVCAIKILVLELLIMPAALPSMFNTAFDAISYFLLLTPEAITHAPFMMVGSYIDMFWMTETHIRSRRGLLSCFAAMALRRLFWPGWFLVRRLGEWFWWLWCSKSTIATGVFGLSALWWHLPAKWKQNCGYYLWAYPTVWPNTILDAILYGTWLAGSRVMQCSAALLRQIVLLRHPLPTQLFSYPDDAPKLSDASKQIRLLKLHRRLPFFPLSAELEAHTLRDMPLLYHAISYVWAYGPQDMRPVIVNGKVMHVTGTVHDILSRCASFITTHYIWIDSICIDQGEERAHLEEKSQQIRLMTEIYQGAINVLVCLGEGPSLLALMLLRELKDVRQMFGSLGEIMLIQHVGGFLPRQRTDMVLRARIKALVDLLQHPWFRRVWVVQEAVMARHVTFHYGHESMQMGVFEDMIQFFTENVTAFVMLLFLGSDGSFHGPIKTASLGMGLLRLPLVRKHQIKALLGETDSIEDVLREFSEREAKQPIDKIFALIGISKDKPQLSSLIDYTRTPEDILLNLAEFLLESNRGLKFDLAGIGYPGRHKIPSWAVDWTVPTNGAESSLKLHHPEKPYRATKATPLQATWYPSDREIEVRGLFVDRVNHVLPIAGVDPDRIDYATASAGNAYPVTAYELARANIPDPYPHASDNQPLREAVWRTMIGDKTVTERPAPSSALKSLEFGLEFSQATMSGAQSRIGSYANYVDSMYGAAGAFKFAGPDQPQMYLDALQNPLDIPSMLYDSTAGSRHLVFCTTEKGYIGMVPPLSQPGDRIFLVLGMKVPCVVRSGEKSEDGSGRYQLVGESYVHGIMDGEALDSVDTEEETISLF